MVSFPNGKINIGLQVKDKRPDGFHNLETIFYPVRINDILDVVPAKEGFSFVQTGNPIAGKPEENLCVKAWQLIKAEYPDLDSVKIHLHKLIPTGAGLGGGSADAALLLKSINEIFDLQLSREKLLEMALKLGSDCPFFILNQPAFAKGRGEQLEMIGLDLSAYQIIVVNPGIHINTGEAFKMLIPYTESNDLKKAVAGPIEMWKNSINNDFEQPVFSKFPEIGLVKQSLYNAGAIYASMSGSGSSCYGIFPAEAAPVITFPDHYKIYRIIH